MNDVLVVNEALAKQVEYMGWAVGIAVGLVSVMVVLVISLLVRDSWREQANTKAKEVVENWVRTVLQDMLIKMHRGLEQSTEALRDIAATGQEQAKAFSQMMWGVTQMLERIDKLQESERQLKKKIDAIPCVFDHDHPHCPEPNAKLPITNADDDDDEGDSHGSSFPGARI
jgi:hypothetical protein